MLFRSGIAVSEGDEVASIELRLNAPRGALPPYPFPRIEEVPARLELVPIHLGDIEGLSAERFSPIAGSLGYWQPVDFAVRYGIGVSMLQPYGPEKIPVVFVHGAQGTPQNFDYLVAHLDRNRYQPWVYSYPSGIRLALASHHLTRVLDEMQHRLGFERVIVIAHSVGGLVARDAVNEIMRRPTHRFVDRLITLSTPWAGHESASLGLAHSPVTIPSWIDMAVGSDFLRSLFPAPSSNGPPFFLLYSFEGGHSGARNTDGVVSLRSQLEPQAQGNATRTFGFPEDHNSILKSADVARTVGALLASSAGTRSELAFGRDATRAAVSMRDDEVALASSL